MRQIPRKFRHAKGVSHGIAYAIHSTERRTRKATDIEIKLWNNTFNLSEKVGRDQIIGADSQEEFKSQSCEFAALQVISARSIQA